ncbi:MAG TPA: Ig-like domain-containing protein [Patescibacteria group bacterium]|nr:Ig-like domain-containing protein [Patescibacteria group bacterium]
MPAFRLITAAALALAFAVPLTAPTPTRAAETPFKVALIVGPMGSNTSWNRQHADDIAQQAISMGATVAKAYSPNATYAKVRAAVAGANIIVYLGHGSGYPNPYHGSLLADRNNGWGLNTTTTHGDQDSWANHTLVYCGEKALEGHLTSNDGADQRKYCAGGAIAPAPGFVMVYIGSCYTAGGNEDGSAMATNSDAYAHLAYYSRPMISALGGSGYFAGHHVTGVIGDLLANPDKSYGDIFWDNLPWDVRYSWDLSHKLVSGAREWITKEPSNPYWTYAFAGNPARTFNGGTSTFTAPTGTGDFSAPWFKSRTPAPSATGVSRSANLLVTFTEPVSGATGGLTLWRGTTKISVSVSYNASTRTATINPANTLAAGVTYTVKASSSIKDAVGNRLKASSWKFKTAS